MRIYIYIHSEQPNFSNFGKIYKTFKMHTQKQLMGDLLKFRIIPRFSVTRVIFIDSFQIRFKLIKLKGTYKGFVVIFFNLEFYLICEAFKVAYTTFIYIKKFSKSFLFR